MKDLVSIFIGKDDEGNSLELVYSDIGEFRTTNTVLNGAIGYDRFMWNIAISAVLNNSPEQVLFYDVDSYAHDWTNTIRHYRRVLIKKDETYYSFLSFLLEEMYKEKDNDMYTIVLFKSYDHVYNLRGENGEKCRNLFEILLKEGPAHNMFFICKINQPEERIKNYEEVFNTEIAIDHIFGPGAEIRIKSIQTNRCISKRFTIPDKRFSGRLNDYLHRELCGPKYYFRQLRKRLQKSKTERIINNISSVKRKRRLSL